MQFGSNLQWLQFLQTCCVLTAYQNNPWFPRSGLGSHRRQFWVTNSLWIAALHQPGRHTEPVGKASPGSCLSLRLQVLPPSVAWKGVPRRHWFCRPMLHDVGAGTRPGRRIENSEGNRSGCILYLQLFYLNAIFFIISNVEFSAVYKPMVFGELLSMT